VILSFFSLNLQFCTTPSKPRLPPVSNPFSFNELEINKLLGAYLWIERFFPFYINRRQRTLVYLLRQGRRPKLKSKRRKRWDFRGLSTGINLSSFVVVVVVVFPPETVKREQHLWASKSQLLCIDAAHAYTGDFARLRVLFANLRRETWHPCFVGWWRGDLYFCGGVGIVTFGGGGEGVVAFDSGGGGTNTCQTGVGGSLLLVQE